MIPRETIAQVLETARIEEVVGEFVRLRKSGQNYKGLSPFTDEKNPSFYVSPSKNIYKCFSSGKGGNAVNFLMEHEHLTYPEAIRYLAKKYNIEIQEEERSPEQEKEFQEREALHNLTDFANKYFISQLFETEKGKAIGLEYLLERDLKEDTIRKFELGYSQEEWDDFTKFAQESGYKLDYLEKTGLTIVKEGDKKYDRFRGRVIFPIHNLSGRVIGFGARTLKKEDNIPKYVNSPESEIYNKSKLLYGLYFAKGEIVRHDNCYLVEGYTDVISLHQAGVQNVVASSGTALTTEQIRLIRRYSKNITILYDGDPAGLQASFRGIDMILEEGMNVRVVLFPEGEDPDSYARQHRRTELEEFITTGAVDFITFKARHLVKEAGSDPIKKAGLIREIVQSIALVPDSIYRSVYVKECSSLLDVPEQALMNELNKILRASFRKKSAGLGDTAPLPETTDYYPAEQKLDTDPADTEFHEMEIIRILLMYGHHEIIFIERKDDFHPPEESRIGVARFIVDEIVRDGITFSNDKYQAIFDIYKQELEEHENVPDEQIFINHEDEEMSKVAVNLLASQYELSPNWEKKGITVVSEGQKLHNTVVSTVLSFKGRTIERQLIALHDEIKELEKDPANDEDLIIKIAEYKKLKEISMQIQSQLGGRVVIR